MKKILIALLSLVMALVMCFTVVACGGDNDGKPDGTNPGTTDTDKKDPPKDDNTVSIKLNDALKVIDGVLSAQGFTATATYTLSTKNTETLTDSVSIDKRGSKIKIDDDLIIDYDTGYWYENVGDGVYAFDQDMTAGNIEYAKYLISTFATADSNGKITAQYGKDKKTINFTVNLAENVNKYLDPFYSAYSTPTKKMGDMLDDYSKLLFGKGFDEAYKTIADYVKNPKNTLGDVLDLLEEKMGVDLETLLAQFDIEIPAEIMTAVKNRQVGEAVAGAYNYVKKLVSDMMGGAMPADVSDDASDADGDDYDYEDGMTSVALGLLDAVLSDEITEDEVKAALAEIDQKMLPMLKDLSVKMIVDMAFAQEGEQPSELYTVIKDGVKLKNLDANFTLTVNDDKALTGLKAEFLFAHTYAGEAKQGYTVLADNDYLAKFEFKIDEYKTEVADFDIKFRPNADYKTSVAQVVYDLNDKDVSVYFETAGQKVEVAGVMYEIRTPDGVETELEDVSEGAFKFDEKTSSFVFDAEFVKSALENADAGTQLTAFVHFEEEDDTWYGITLVYLNDDIEQVSEYLTDYFMSFIMGSIGGAGSDAPISNGSVSQN